MIINVPLQIDEASFEKKVNDDYANKVEQLLLSKIETVLLEADDRYWTNRSSKTGLSKIIHAEVDIFLEDHKDEIIESAGEHLAQRLVRTKRAKELIEETANECERLKNENDALQEHNRWLIKNRNISKGGDVNG